MGACSITLAAAASLPFNSRHDTIGEIGEALTLSPATSELTDLVRLELATLCKNASDVIELGSTLWLPSQWTSDGSGQLELVFPVDLDRVELSITS